MKKLIKSFYQTVSPEELENKNQPHKEEISNEELQYIIEAQGIAFGGGYDL